MSHIRLFIRDRDGTILKDLHTMDPDLSSFIPD